MVDNFFWEHSASCDMPEAFKGGEIGDEFIIVPHVVAQARVYAFNVDGPTNALPAFILTLGTAASALRPKYCSAYL
jgi:hypothetical protein